MTDLGPEFLENLLRECLATQPSPWYLSEYLKETHLPREPLEAYLDQLRMAGLISLTPWVQGLGQGYQLTPFGQQVLEQPRLTARLRTGQPPAAPQEAEATPERHALAGLRGEAVRQALTDDARPIITRALVAVNVIWFLVGLLIFMAQYDGRVGAYLAGKGDAKLNQVYIDIGSQYLPEVIDHDQWWRLLSYCFVHNGAMHLFMNMFVLFMLGPMLERMWGKPAFLLVYLAAGLGGGAAALVFTPTANVLGASGAVCGLFGSLATWLYMNRHALPEQFVAAWRQTIIMNLILIGIVSAMPHVSLAAHAGGFVLGALVSAPLNAARFGVGPQRWLGWIGAVAILLVGLCLVYPPVMRFATSEEYKRMQILNERSRHPAPPESPEVHSDETRLKNLGILAKQKAIAQAIIDGSISAFEIRKRAHENVLHGPALSNDPDLASEIFEAFQENKSKLERCIVILEKADTSKNPTLIPVLQAGLAYFRATSTFARQMAAVCEAGGRMNVEERQVYMSDAAALKDLEDELVRTLKKGNS